MDNLAHTLLGLALAKAGVERVSPMATTALVVSSNMPDIDVLTRVGGDALDYLRYHRGFTHSLVGVVLLAVLLTPALTYCARRFRRDPAKPVYLFLAACLGGLGHTFMDFTNSYGVRPLLPFSTRWFYGDLVVVIDPWIWLILGSSVVWLTAKTSLRVALWVIIGILTSLPIALAFRSPSESGIAIPTSIRLVWFVGLAGVAIVALLLRGRGRSSLARWSLVILTIYYGSIYCARETAVDRVAASHGGAQVTAWPTPANPTLWQIVIATPDSIQTGLVSLFSESPGSLTARREIGHLDPRIAHALRQAEEPRAFLEFARFVASTVNEEPDAYRVKLRDLRFNLEMEAFLDRDLNVTSTRVNWF